MYNPSRNETFSPEDRKVYYAWLQGTLAMYGAIALSAIAAVAFLAAASTPNVAEMMTAAVALASP
jgi:hypothetical protein